MADITELEAASASAVHNQSVLKAVALIGCFVDNTDGMTLTELAKRTGLNVSTAYRMLQTLTRTGVLRRNEGEERYHVGPLLLTLAGSTFSAHGYGVVLDVLRGLAEDTGESVSLGIRDANCVAVVLSVGSKQSLRFEHRAGDRVPIHCSAMGKALLAHANISPAETVIGLGRLHGLTPKSIVKPERLVEELEAIRKRGFAVSDEENHLGVRSIAMVAMRGNQPARVAIGIQGPIGRMTDSRIEAFVDTLRGGADLVAQLPMLDRLPTA